MAKDPGDKLKNALKFNISNSSRGFSNQIGGSDRLDLIRVTLNQRSTLNVAMTKLKANANLRLLDSRGKKTLAQSRLQGKQNESIVTPLDAGTYYIEVKPGSVRDSTRYTLTLSAGNTAPKLTNVSLSSRAGATTLITNSTLKATDSEQQFRELVYTLTSLPQGGKVQLNGVALGLGGRFTQADIDDGRLNYAGSGSITRLTDNSTNDAVAGISGSNLIWNNFEGLQNQQTIKPFFYDGQANKAVQLTAPGIVSAGAQGIFGSDVVWIGSNVTTNQIFLYKGATGTSTQITNGNRSATNAFISGSNLAWSSTDGQLSKAFFYNGQTGKTTELTAPGITSASSLGVSDSRVIWQGVNSTNNVELFLFDISTGVSRQLTNDALIEYSAAVYGINAIWNSSTADIQTFKSFFYNGQTNQITELTSPGVTIALANTILESNVVWTGIADINSGSEVFLYDGLAGTSTRLTNNDTNDVGNHISGSNIVWTGYNGKDTDIFFYDGTTKTTVELTNNTEGDAGALMDGSNIAWNTNDGTDNEVVFRRFAPTDQFSFTVTDGASGVTPGTINLTITQG
ncbi:MAG: pre-peptidase C-terminal domain-containing protein [Timaviella obliquedivisa GSE-PSE-MK23-08B]|jgi:hypothetical protein|nr:pre-peptidase C-terminal domain-containing protein [Timaviella obliquedivisa GSE-PSE-MK23-08B]